MCEPGAAPIEFSASTGIAPEGWYPPHAYHPAYQHSAYPQHVYAENGGPPVASHHLGGFPEGAAALVAASGQLPAAAVGHRPGPA